MGMNSPLKRVSEDSSSADVMDMRKMVAVEEKYITRSYFKEDKTLDTNIPPKRNSSKISLNKLGRKLAEVFRTDFITAMKVPETQQLPPGEYLALRDTWRQEWEKGVQVPVNPESTQKTAVCRSTNIEFAESETIQFPLELFRATVDVAPNVEVLRPAMKLKFDQEKYNHAIDRSNTSYNYDLDGQDVYWLKKISSLRTLKKATAIDELTMERAITWFERECFEKMAHAVATKEGLSIEYDETTTCNICLSPDAEDGNEIVFCDACMMCAHQHCYGVLDIPEGTWLCNPCSRGILSPPCCLCPNKGGAMKRIKLHAFHPAGWNVSSLYTQRDSFEWIHVICAWWIPEVKIEDFKYIERITKDKIPPSRWNLSCNVCRDKMGACIQCTMKRCVRAYHVTCAVKEGLEMKTVVVPEKNDVQHISFCSKHCTPVPPDKNPNLVKSEAIETNRIIELRKLESDFYTLVSVQKASRELKLCKEATRRLLSYWTMKRRANENAPLIKLTMEQHEKLSGKQGDMFIAQQKTLEMERFLHLRQDLERLRNLCYMIVRREKMRKEVHRSSIEIFYKQNDILLDKNEDLTGENLDFIRHRTTKFSQFSENYQTERDYENEHGTPLTIFDSTIEESDELLNSSQLERINLDELQRVTGVKNLKDSKNEIQNSKNVTQEQSDIVKTKTEPDRNIFDLLEPAEATSSDDNFTKNNRCSRDNRTSSPIRDTKLIENKVSCPSSGSPLESMCTKSTEDPSPEIVTEIEKEDPDNSTSRLNGFLDVEDEKINFSEPLTNNAIATSRLAKKGKKRFRNLHNINREGCRNSPRLRRMNSEDVKETVGVKTKVLDPEKFSKIISEAKRRRLNSLDDYATEYEEEPDYVRVTRSRVASCS